MNIARLTLSAAVLVFAASAAHADSIVWAKWSSATSGSPGSASGSIAAGSGIGVTYSGQTSGLLTNYPSWNPSTTFSGGTVGNAPPAANNSVQIEGGNAYTETISFSSAIVNPVLAIWSLGQGGLAASFNFNSNEPFTIESGGPSSEYGGSSIYAAGNNVYGQEGNGTIQFTGTFTSLSFTTPTYENYYAFTVGDDISASGVTPPSSVTPEPESLSLLGLGIATLPFLRSRFTRNRR